MKVNEAVHLIECPLENIFTGVYAIIGEGVALIDAGLPDSPETAIFPYLRGIGRDPSDISLVVITHGHDDHCGGAAAIVKASGARIAAHPADAAYVENPAKLWLDLHERFPMYHPRPAVERCAGSNVDLLLEDGMRLDLGPFEAEIVHTPGHTDGSICIYDRKGRSLFTGDSVQGRGTVVQSGPLIYGSMEDYVSSMMKLKALDPRTMMLDHQYLPLDGAVITGTDVAKALDVSVKCVEEIAEVILKSIDCKNSADMHQLVDEVKAIYGVTPTSMTPCSIVEAALRSLQRRGSISRSSSGRWVPIRRPP